MSADAATKKGRRSPFTMPAFGRRDHHDDGGDDVDAAASAGKWARAPGGSSDGGAVTGDMIWNESIADALGYGKG